MPGLQKESAGNLEVVRAERIFSPKIIFQALSEKIFLLFYRIF
jgi:hypothetical protein